MAGDVNPLLDKRGGGTPMPNPGRPISPGARSNPGNGNYTPSPGNRPPSSDCSIRPDKDHPTVRGS
jgi:hypothetical protein